MACASPLLAPAPLARGSILWQTKQPKAKGELHEKCSSNGTGARQTTEGWSAKLGVMRLGM